MKKNNRLLKCRVCGKKDKSVKERVCAYQREINNKVVLEVICDECEQVHRDDI